MENNLKLYLPLSFEQVLELVRQLSTEEKQKLINLIQKDKEDTPFLVEEPTLTHFASEKILAKDWLSPEEDEAWQDL